MRSAIIIAACALAVFTAPVPEPNPIYKSGGTGCARVIAGVCVKSGKREVEGPQITRLNDGKRVVVDARAIRNEGKRSVREKIVLPDEDSVSDEDIEARSAMRHGSDSKRDADEDIVEARAIRNEGKRSVREKSVVPDEDIEARGGVRHGSDSKRDAEPTVRPVKDQKRTDEDEDNVEARAIRNEGRRSVREKIAVSDEEAVPDVDVEARSSVRPSGNGAVCTPGHITNYCGFNKRTASNDIKTEFGKRTPEAEPIDRINGDKRSDEPEPESDDEDTEVSVKGFSRPNHQDKRIAEPEPINRAANSRREAEPIIIGSHSDQNHCHGSSAHVHPDC